LNPLGTLGGDQLKKANFDFGTPMTRSIERSLTGMGYTVVPVAYSNRNSSKFLTDYNSLPQVGADAVFDTRVIYAGYAPELIPGIRDDRLYIHLHSQLVSTITKEVIYSEMVSLVGDEITVGGQVSFAPWKTTEPKKYFFRQPFGASSYPGPLVTHREKAIEGLNAGMDPVSRALTAGLKR
jgi:hypothetical protein